MKFLADQDVYAVTVRLLRELHHDVAEAGRLGLALLSVRTFRTNSREFPPPET